MTVDFYLDRAASQRLLYPQGKSDWAMHQVPGIER